MTSNTNTNKTPEAQAQATTGQKQDSSTAGQKTDNAGNKVEPMKKDAEGKDVKQTEGAAESTPAAKTGSDKR